MTKKKYVLCPGFVKSNTDGQTHYIDALVLASLYGVHPRECDVYEPASWWTPRYWQEIEKRQAGMFRLTPRVDGNYTLPGDLGP